MTDEAPELRPAPPPRRGVRVGPFSGRQLLTVASVVILAGVGLTLATRPIASGEPGVTAFPASTVFVVGPPPTDFAPATRRPS